MNKMPSSSETIINSWWHISLLVSLMIMLCLQEQCVNGDLSEEKKNSRDIKWKCLMGFFAEFHILPLFKNTLAVSTWTNHNAVLAVYLDICSFSVALNLNVGSSSNRKVKNNLNSSFA